VFPYVLKKGDTGLKSRRILIFILTVSVLVLIGYYVVINDNQQAVSEERIRLAIEREISGIKNLEIKIIEEFRGTSLVMYSFDLGDGHYIACRHFDKHNHLSGGSGPIKADTRQPISVISFGNETENYFITYGEVYNSSINAVEIVYYSGEKKRVEPRKGAYLFIADQETNMVMTVSAYDSTGQVVFQVP
jgi:hypothetical protein